MLPTEPAALLTAIYSPHSLIRAGLVHLVQQHPRRVVLVGGTDLDPHEPLGPVDVVVYDLARRWGHPDELRQLVAAVPVVGVTREGRDDLSERARAAGVRQVVGEDVSAVGLVDALARVTGHRVVHRHRASHDLTPREREVLDLVGAGLTNAQIADELVLSVNSIKSHLRLAYRKINVSNRQQAVLWAVRSLGTPVPTLG